MSESAKKWIREGGFFLIISILVTIFKYLVLQFLPKLFVGLPLIDFGFPGTEITVLGKTFPWYVVGYSVDQGGLPYFCAYMIAMVIGEVINFFMQRNITFKSKGNIYLQGLFYLIAFCVVTFIVNSINCIWVSVASDYVSDFIYNIFTTMFNGLVSMIIFFFVNKLVFSRR